MPIRIATGHQGRTAARDAKRVEISPLWSERGLAVHNTYAAKGWTITHLASGYAVVQGIRSHRNAITVAKRLLDAGDWTRSKTAITTDRHLKDRAFAIRSEARLLGLI